MKKNILITIVILVIVLGVYLFTRQKKEVEVPINTQTNTNNTETKVPLITETKEIQIGDMVLNIPADLLVQKDIYTVNIFIPGEYAETINVNERIKNKIKNFRVSLYKNDNKEKYSLEDWLGYKGPQTEKGSRSIDEEKYIKINNLDAYLTKYFARENGANFEYYNKEEVYLLNKTDIYDISNYRKSSSQYNSLTAEEQKSIENYEKIVDQIIQSIHFVK